MTRTLVAAVVLLAVTASTPAFAIGANRNVIIKVELTGPRYEEAKGLCKGSVPSLKDCVQAKLVAQDVLALAQALVPYPRARSAQQPPR